MNIEAAKHSIIQFIQEVQSEYLIQRILSFINQLKKKRESGFNADIEESNEMEDMLAVAYEPVPDFVSVEELAKQQGYSNEKFREAHASIDHSLFADEDIDELLAAIK